MDVMACGPQSVGNGGGDFREIMASASGPPESTVMFSGAWDWPLDHLRNQIPWWCSATNRCTWCISSMTSSEVASGVVTMKLCSRLTDAADTHPLPPASSINWPALSVLTEQGVSAALLDVFAPRVASATSPP